MYNATFGKLSGRRLAPNSEYLIGMGRESHDFASQAVAVLFEFVVQIMLRLAGTNSKTAITDSRAAIHFMTLMGFSDLVGSR